MEAERRCLYCNSVLGDEWTRSDQKYCTTNCKTSYWYRKKYKTYYDEQYRQLKRKWEKSPEGKRMGVPIRVWIKMYRHGFLD